MGNNIVIKTIKLALTPVCLQQPPQNTSKPFWWQNKTLTPLMSLSTNVIFIYLESKELLNYIFSSGKIGIKCRLFTAYRTYSLNHVHLIFNGEVGNSVSLSHTYTHQGTISSAWTFHHLIIDPISKRIHYNKYLELL